MKKYTYLYSKCSLCFKQQNKAKDTPIFSYCIKCNTIICSSCINNHLIIKEKNHPNLNKEYIIKSNEKNIRCLQHPTKKYFAFCFDCNNHICIKCLESKKHTGHRKDNIIEVLITDEIKDKLDKIIDTYEKN